MKRFKLLSALFVGLIGLISFGYCGTITTKLIGQTVKHDGSNTNINVACTNFLTGSVSTVQSSWKITYDFSSFSSNQNATLVCKNYSQYNGNLETSLSSTTYYNNFYTTPTFTFNVSGDRRKNRGVGYCCLQLNGYGLTSVTYSDYIVTIESNNVPTVSCPSQYTSEECQQEYSLMPISSCNSEYCGLNGLCPEYTGSTMSELYINGINHLGAPIINLTIPLEQAWDYNYTGDVMNINLSGENNVDYEYMDNIIRTQNSKPNTTDLNNIISVLLPKFVPGLVILLFILFVFRFIKKIF